MPYTTEELTAGLDTGSRVCFYYQDKYYAALVLAFYPKAPFDAADVARADLLVCESIGRNKYTPVPGLELVLRGVLFSHATRTSMTFDVTV